jgi:hypothetical protein
MIMVIASPVSVESLLADPSVLPSVEELRPSSCPGCGQAAYASGGRLQIVGHGTYGRQVLGLLRAAGEAVVRIRRYLCRGCGQTMSVLPAELYPRRWYAGAAILVSLWLHLLEGIAAARVRNRFDAAGETAGWKSVRRWRRDLLFRLWGWLARQLGVTGEALSRSEGQRRLHRLLALGDAVEASEWAVRRAACKLVVGTVHAHGTGRVISRDPP